MGKQPVGLSAEAMQERFEDMKSRMKDARKTVEKEVGEHPLKAVALAFGAGLLAGAFLLMMKRK